MGFEHAKSPLLVWMPFVLLLMLAFLSAFSVFVDLSLYLPLVYPLNALFLSFRFSFIFSSTFLFPTLVHLLVVLSLFGARSSSRRSFSLRRSFILSWLFLLSPFAHRFHLNRMGINGWKFHTVIKYTKSGTSRSKPLLSLVLNPWKCHLPHIFSVFLFSFELPLLAFIAFLSPSSSFILITRVRCACAWVL